MPIEFDKKELVKYPFLKEAHSLVSQKAYSLTNLLELESGKRLAQKARDRIKAALNADYVFDNVTGASGEIPEHEILSYAIARMIVSCMNERPVIDKLCRYESERAAYFLQREEPEKKEYIARSLGINLRSGEMKVNEYVELVRDLHDSKWQLVNRDVNAGNVAVSRDEAEELLKERIRSMLHSQLPLPVPEEIKEKFKPLSEEVSAVYKERVMEQFGEVDEGAFPPCMKAIISSVTDGTNIPHTARFSLTAFMHTIGMDINGIVGVFTRAPDFNADMTMYQVDHISGGGGTEYTPPQCVTMKTYGLCCQDAICKSKKFQHPLSYYKYKKKVTGNTSGASSKSQSAPPDASPSAHSSPASPAHPKSDRIGARIDAKERERAAKNADNQIKSDTGR